MGLGKMARPQERALPPDTHITLQLVPSGDIISAGGYTVTIDAEGNVIYKRMLNHGHPTNVEFDEVADILTAAEPGDRR